MNAHTVKARGGYQKTKQMTALELYKFINENHIEWRWDTNGNHRDVLIFPSIWVVEDFNDLLSPTVYDDGGIKCVMMDRYFAFWMEDICSYYGIELTEVFGEDKNKLI